MTDIPLGRLRQDLGDIVRQVESLVYLKDLVDVIAKAETIRSDTAVAGAKLEDLKLQLQDRQQELKQAAAKQSQELSEQKRIHEAILAAKIDLTERGIQDKQAKAAEELKAIEAQVKARRDDLAAARREFTSTMAALKQQEADLIAQIKVFEDSLAKLRERLL